MSNSVAGKVAWVTGGGAGIGAAICKDLAARGAKVLCTDLTLSKVEKVVAEITAEGGTAIAMQADIVKEEDNAAAAARCISEWGALDMVAVNAAIDAARGKDVTTCTLEEMKATADVNYFGAFLGIKHAALVMKEAGIHGHIVVISSGAGLKATPGSFAYSASKHGLHGIAKLASVELLPTGIRVNTLCLGMVDTEGLRDALNHFGVTDVPDYIDTPEYVAEEITNFMGDNSALLNGQIIGLERGLCNTQYISAVNEHGSRYPE